MSNICICELHPFGRMINTGCYHYLELIKKTKDPQTKKALIKTRKNFEITGCLKIE